MFKFNSLDLFSRKVSQRKKKRKGTAKKNLSKYFAKQLCGTLREN